MKALNFQQRLLLVSALLFATALLFIIYDLAAEMERIKAMKFTVYHRAIPETETGPEVETSGPAGGLKIVRAEP